MRTQQEQQQAAKRFADEWNGKGYEKGESQKFWIDLLRNVFDVQDFASFISFEDQVKLDHTSFIDGYIAATKVLIEQKSIDKDLRAPVRQSDGLWLTPFQQAKRYITELPVSKHPRWVITCNFKSFLVYDMDQPNGEPEEILLENFEKEYYRLSFIADTGNVHLQKELEVSKQAGAIIGEIYDAILQQYNDADNPGPETLRSLNILCVRIVFCLYAEDAGIFGHKSIFGDYLQQFEAKDLRRALIDLFKVLDQKPEERDPYLEESLAAFPYVDGGLFINTDSIIPQLTQEIKDLLIKHASSDFDWSAISPTIFGAIFESTLNPETRRSGGMHYTSIENIHKVIDPLFLDELRDELDQILGEKVGRKRTQKLQEYQNKLASLKFLDPACGSGNFLTETYLSLRRLENEVIRELSQGVMTLGDIHNPIKVSIHQFYGIEINDFAVTVATTALWISEAQMLIETEKIVSQSIDFLPLKHYANIKEGNALRLSWTEWDDTDNHPIVIAGQTNIYPAAQAPLIEDTVVKYETVNVYSDNIHIHTGQQPRPTHYVKFDYIMGNPPFVGYSFQSKDQKNDMLSIYVDEKGKPYKTAGKIDYVAGWYMKAARIMANNPAIRAAFVSTNSITQGEQVAAIWQPLFERWGIHIDFAYRTFRWDSEADIKAHVHCVIVGFSNSGSDSKRIYISDGQSIPANNINSYLIDAPDAWIDSHNKPICNVPDMVTGNRPADGGHLIIEAEDYEEFIKKEPSALRYIKKLTGAQEYINNKPRYCLWLVGISPAELRKMPLVMARVEACRKDRLNGAPDRQKLADTPWLFRETKNPKTYIIVPLTSSEQRRYIPLGFMDSETIPTNSAVIIPNATIYHFGILTSNVHMAWMRAVCGRLKSDYRYSKDIVYNNFPWPTPTNEQKIKIEQTAQAILDARANYPDSSLADLYDEVTMPPELRKAHQDNDRAVMTAYGFDAKITESKCVAALFKLYQKLTKEK